MDKITRTLLKYIEKGDDNKPDAYFGFMSFSLFLNPSDLKLLMVPYLEKIKPFISEIDYFVPLFHSGSPLIGWLQSYLEKPIFFLTLKKNCKIDERINQNIPKKARICLIDTNINRTSTFWLAANELENTGNYVDRMAVLFFNDLWKKPDKRLMKLNETQRIICLQKASLLKFNK